MALRDALAARSQEAAPCADAHVIGLPRALMYYRLHTKWRTFFEALGREVRVSAPSDRGTFEHGQALSVDECCLASKLYLGHVAALAEDPTVDAIFVPSLAPAGRFRNWCTKFQALPDLTESAFAVAERPVRVLSELLYEGSSDKEERASYVRLAAKLGVSAKEAARAWKGAARAQREADASLARAQADLLASMAKLSKEDRPLRILVAAHPYVAHDPYVGGVVTDALKANGATVVFADECDHAHAIKRSQDFSPSLPWTVNREVVGAILLMQDQVDGVVLMSAFPCGPDSMADDAIARCVHGLPLLTLTVDAQSGTAGVETRVESFCDILSYQRRGGYLNA